MKQVAKAKPQGHAALTAIDLDRADLGIEATRNRALITFAVENVQHMDAVELAEAQSVLRHGATMGIWVTPRDWLTPGTRDVFESINLRRRIVDCLPEQLQSAAIDEISLGAAARTALMESLRSAVLILSRYLVLLRIGPAGMGRIGGHRSLGPSTLLNIAYLCGPALLAQAVVKQVGRAAQDFSPSDVSEGGPQKEVRLLGSVTPVELANLTVGMRRLVFTECRRMRMLSARALWWDVPTDEAASLAAAMTGPVLHNEQPAERDSHLPLPDDYVAQMGRQSIWLMRDLAPNLLAVAQKMTELWATTGAMGWADATVSKVRGKGVRELLAAHDWHTQEGQPFSAPPFPLRLPKRNGFSKAAAAVDHDGDAQRWPPTSYRDVMALLGVVQLSHYFIVALSMGARQSEVLSLQRDCVMYAADGRAYANGRTYKLVQRHEGEWRDWHLPDAAMEAIEQQVRVVSLGEQLELLNPATDSGNTHLVPIGDAQGHLWARLSGATSASDASAPLREINKALVSFARALYMDTAPGGQNLRSHRFRKTLARLVALALTQAPKLLMEVFGHKSIEMTLYYILTDKDLRSEIETVSRELRVMRAKEVVERMVEADLAGKSTDGGNLGGYGGLGAVSVMSAVGVHRERVHRRGEQWGAKNVLELAELLTLQGKAWQQVRPGVLCTKFPGEAGPCNKSKGRPEPSKCDSSCDHRLEEAFLREDVDGSIRESLVAYEQSLADDEMLTSAHWAAQVRAHVPRFPDLREKWMRNATVRALMGSEPSAVIA